jgi:hypothetical protein
MSDARSSWRAVGLVAGVVVVAVMLGALGLGALTLADASNQYVERAVVQAEPQYSVVHGGDVPTVSYVVTTPRRADRYLASISWASDYYSTLDCHCVPSQQALVGAAGTNSSELRLIPQEPGPVAVVELSGVSLGASDPTNALGIPCVRQPCPVFLPTVYEAPVAFLVVNLSDGKTTGGMIATPSNGSSSFSLATLGPVTSWSGPSDFGKPIGKYKVVVVDTPHQTQQ